MELDSHSWMDCLAAESSRNSCFSDTVFVTLLRTAVETAISGVHKLLRTGGVPTSLTLIVVLAVSSLFTDRSARTSYSSLPDPSPLPFPVPNKPYGFCGRKAPWKKEEEEALDSRQLGRTAEKGDLETSFSAETSCDTL